MSTTKLLIHAMVLCKYLLTTIQQQITPSIIIVILLPILAGMAFLWIWPLLHAKVYMKGANKGTPQAMHERHYNLKT